MKITDERKGNNVAFQTLALGSVFKSNGDVYMRTEGLEYGDESVYAINLKTGLGINIMYDDLVEPLDAELIIRG